MLHSSEWMLQFSGCFVMDQGCIRENLGVVSTLSFALYSVHQKATQINILCPLPSQYLQLKLFSFSGQFRKFESLSSLRRNPTSNTYQHYAQTPLSVTIFETLIKINFNSGCKILSNQYLTSVCETS